VRRLPTNGRAIGMFGSSRRRPRRDVQSDGDVLVLSPTASLGRPIRVGRGLANLASPGAAESKLPAHDMVDALVNATGNTGRVHFNDVTVVVVKDAWPRRCPPAIDTPI
jgi:hypothetical protein